MHLNRNQFFLSGIVILLLGIQLRCVESYELNEQVSQQIAERMKKPPTFIVSTDPQAYTAPSSFFGPQKQVVRPPEWLGWALISVGSVLILHSLAMKAPGG